MLRFSRAWLLLVGAIAVLAMVAVACGGGDDEGTKTATATKTATGTPKATATKAATATPKATVVATATPKATSTTTGATATPKATSTTTGATATPPPAVTEAPTATPTAEVVEPDDGWSDTEILLGSHFAQSGTYGASFAPVLAGFKAYINYVNAEQGGVCGRKIVLDALDDNYDPARATEVIRKLVDQEKVFAVVLGLGTAAHSAVWEYLNEKGIPDLFVMTGAHKWAATPEQHPWTFAGLPDYFIEGTLYGNWISDNMPGTKVGVLYQNDDYGRDELAGVKNGLDPTKNEVVSEQAFESTAVSIASQVANLKAAGVGAVICGCIPGHAAQAIKGANAMGWKPQWFIGYVNSDPVMFSYASPGDMEGTLTMQGNKLSGWTDDPGIAAHIEIMKTYGNAPVGNFTVEGQLVAELTVHALSLTCDNPTHEGLKEAVESIQGWQSELMLEGGPGFSWSPTDHNTVEAMRLLRAKLIPGGGGVWEYEGPILSFNP